MPDSDHVIYFMSVKMLTVVRWLYSHKFMLSSEDSSVSQYVHNVSSGRRCWGTATMSEVYDNWLSWVWKKPQKTSLPFLCFTDPPCSINVIPLLLHHAQICAWKIALCFYWSMFGLSHEICHGRTLWFPDAALLVVPYDTVHGIKRSTGAPDALHLLGYYWAINV